MSGKLAAAASKGRTTNNSRSAAANQSQAHGSNAAAASEQPDGDDGKQADEAGDQQQLGDAEADGDEQEGAEAEPDAGARAVASLLKEMQDMRDELRKLKQQPQQQQQQSLSLSPPSAQSSELAALVRAMQESQERQAEQARKQQAASAAQLLLLQSLGELPTFSGKGGDTTLIAHEWLQQAEDFFTAREQATGIDAVMGDRSRLLTAATVLQDDARRWYSALPRRPATWAEFQDALKARFCSVPSERIRVDRLTEFVDKAARLRDKLTVQGMQTFTARFAQLAGEVPEDLVTGRGKLALLARGLPQRYSEVVLQEEAKKPTPPLHEVINTVLARASQKEQAASYGGASSSPSAAPMSLEDITLAINNLGWTPEDVQRNLVAINPEGWAPHDTSGSKPSSSGPSSAPASSGSRPPASSLEEKFDKLLAAFAAQSTKVGAGPAARERNSRRNAPSGALKELPRELAESRKKAGLCIKCGVAKYEPGGHGHNAVTCKAAVDKTTSAEEGRKKAGF
jgi:hypothetical protein